MDTCLCPCEKNSHGEPINRGKNGNCLIRRAPDGLPFQCIGRWSQDKHDYLQRYIEATSGPRAAFLPPKRRKSASFTSSQTGLAYLAGKKDPIEGSPLIAMNRPSAPFSKLILCDIDDENVAILGKRTEKAGSRTSIVHGDCNELISQIVKLIPPHGLNIALVDPFNPRALLWETLKCTGFSESHRVGRLIFRQDR